MAVGLPAPQPLPVLAVEHQVAQKLHACTVVNPKTGRNERAHDLVDLQILAQEETINLVALRSVGSRLFASRGTHDWPPKVMSYPEWETLYAEAADGLAVFDTVEAAVSWANDLVHRAEDTARSK